MSENGRGQYGQSSDKEDMAKFWKAHPTAAKAAGIGAVVLAVGIVGTMVVTQFKIFHDATADARSRRRRHHELPKARVV